MHVPDTLNIEEKPYKIALFTKKYYCDTNPLGRISICINTDLATSFLRFNEKVPPYTVNMGIISSEDYFKSFCNVNQRDKIPDAFVDFDRHVVFFDVPKIAEYAARISPTSDQIPFQFKCLLAHLWIHEMRHIEQIYNPEIYKQVYGAELDRSKLKGTALFFITGIGLGEYHITQKVLNNLPQMNRRKFIRLTASAAFAVATSTLINNQAQSRVNSYILDQCIFKAEADARLFADNPELIEKIRGAFTVTLM